MLYMDMGMLWALAHSPYTYRTPRTATRHAATRHAQTLRVVSVGPGAASAVSSRWVECAPTQHSRSCSPECTRALVSSSTVIKQRELSRQRELVHL